MTNITAGIYIVVYNEYTKVGLFSAFILKNEHKISPKVTGRMGFKPPKNEKKSGAEKPVSLWGASFIEVVKALSDTNPMP